MFESQIASTFRRFSKLERTPRMIVFPIVTDLHVILEDIDPADPGLRNSLNAVEAIHQADELFHFDFFADLGDTGLGLIHNRPAGKGLEMLRTYAETHRKTEKPFFVCMGNHDFEEGLSDPEFFGEIMNRINQERGHHVQFGDNASYGCFDLPEKKIRLLFLNTGDGNPYLFDEKQLDFLQEKLQLPQGWEALLFMHRCPHKNGDNVNAPEKHPSFHRFEKIVVIDRTLMVAQKVSEIDQGFGTFPAIDFFHILFHAHLRFLRLFSITINSHLTIKQKACQHEKKQFHGESDNKNRKSAVKN